MLKTLRIAKLIFFCIMTKLICKRIKFTALVYKNYVKNIFKTLKILKSKKIISTHCLCLKQ